MCLRLSLLARTLDKSNPPQGARYCPLSPAPLLHQTITALEGVSACAATTLLRSQLRDSPLVDWLSAPSHALHGTDTNIVAFILPSVIAGPRSGLTKALVSQICQVLPSYSLPEVIVLVRELPTTRHGKSLLVVDR